MILSKTPLEHIEHPEAAQVFHHGMLHVRTAEGIHVLEVSSSRHQLIASLALRTTEGVLEGVLFCGCPSLLLPTTICSRCFACT